ncbi:GtrA family protein [Xylocopilactobacillus apis]|uniref:Membrane protein n=1 Tax=Xylocopilactobacillus apis TaxID=2932183 RepID=A0AAU9D215_9LACO|nr:GtrA family protein [Xylocopilactobacillus apis]BDR56330.1 membrane protein [Xylocopilactobacillus apis]
MKKISNSNFKFKTFIVYTFFGFLASVVNILIFQLLYHNLRLINLVANSIAFVFANILSYYLNRKFVFKLPKGNLHEMFVEFSTFISSRTLTYFLDITFMFIFATLLKMNNPIQTLILKAVDQIILGLVNYFFSRAIFVSSEQRIQNRTTRQNQLDDP